jgi:mRNA-degrading endonuclease YafQ of YafQ-DinJ toxin-antitoxin module
MRKIIFHKNFDRGFEALNPKLKLKTIETIKLLTINPFAKKLKNHARHWHPQPSLLKFF